MTDSLSIAVHAFASRVLMSFSVDETLFPWSVNFSTSFKGPPSHIHTYIYVYVYVCGESSIVVKDKGDIQLKEKWIHIRNSFGW